MSSYDEHLISMAGGDGDEVDANHHAFLLALVRTQQATLAAVLNLANTAGRTGWRISADELRAVLRQS